MDENLSRYCDLVNKFVICDHFLDEEENDYYITIQSDDDVGIWGKNFLGEPFRKLYNKVTEADINKLLEKYIHFSEIMNNREIIKQQDIEYDIAKKQDNCISIPDDGGVVRCRIIIFDGDNNLEYEVGCDTTIEKVNNFLYRKYRLTIPNPKNRKYIGGLGTVTFLSMSSDKFKSE